MNRLVPVACVLNRGVSVIQGSGLEGYTVEVSKLCNTMVYVKVDT